MPLFADTSFLCALYRQQDNTERAITLMEQTEVLLCTNLVQFEFANGVRFEVFRHRQDHKKGYSELEGVSMLSQFQIAVDQGKVQIVPIDLLASLLRAGDLSEKHTITRGTRALDILHVAAVLTLKGTHFVTFDATQGELAEAEGLVVYN